MLVAPAAVRPVEEASTIIRIRGLLGGLGALDRGAVGYPPSGVRMPAREVVVLSEDEVPGAMSDEVAARIVASVRACSDRSVPGLREVRRAVSGQLKELSAEEVLGVAQKLLEQDRVVPPWFAYELVHHHPAALAALDASRLRRLGEGMSSWGDVDPFACYLSGVAWREGRVSDAEVHGWAASSDRFWRRAALVSSVPLNSRARGGSGDAERTLAICDALRTDRDDLVVKALSWALRELAKRDPQAVRDYVEKREAELAPRVVREVRNKLETGLKNPGKGDRGGEA